MLPVQVPAGVLVMCELSRLMIPAKFAMNALSDVSSGAALRIDICLWASPSIPGGKPTDLRFNKKGFPAKYTVATLNKAGRTSIAYYLDQLDDSFIAWVGRIKARRFARVAVDRICVDFWADD